MWSTFCTYVWPRAIIATGSLSEVTKALTQSIYVVCAVPNGSRSLWRFRLSVISEVSHQVRSLKPFVTRVLNVPTRGTSYRQGPCLCFHKESSTLPEGFMFELGYGKATFSRVERVSIQRDFDSWTGSAVISRAWRLLGDCWQERVPLNGIDLVFLEILIPHSLATGGRRRNAALEVPSRACLLKVNYEISMTIWRDNSVINSPFPFISQHACYKPSSASTEGPYTGFSLTIAL